MRKMLLNVLLVVLVMPLLFMASGMSLSGKGVETKGENGSNPDAVGLPTDCHQKGSRHGGDSLSPRSVAASYVAQIDWLPGSIQIPTGLGGFLAGACVFVPFGLSSWGTWRKRR